MTALARPLLLAVWVLGCGGSPPTPSPSPSPSPSPAPTASPSPSPSPSPTPASHDITIRLTVHGSPYGSSQTMIALTDTTCETRGGYDDIGPGMQAVIHDPSGTVIGFATFTSVGQSTRTEQGTFGRVPYECTFTTVAQGVPDAPSYGVEIGTRGEVRFSRSELAGNGWTADLTLGD